MKISKIITHEKCDKCKKEYKDIYVSFGHPDEDFIWEWECGECGHINERLIKAFPMFGLFSKEEKEFFLKLCEEGVDNINANEGV